jgi:hypothetical protein
MASRTKTKRPGRPNIVGAGAGYITAKFTRRQIGAINRVAGPAPGGRAAAIRQLVDIGIAKTFRRR